MYTLTPEAVAQAAEIVLRAAQGSKEVGYKHDVASVNPSTVGYMHGRGGLLTYPGVDPDVFTTMVGFGGSILSELPASPTVYTDPLFQVITGISAGSGAEPTNICGPAPIGGVLSGGKFTSPFGLYRRDTRQVNIQRLGQRINRADPVDLRLLGRTGGATRWTNSGFQGNILTNEFDTVLFERAVAFDRLLRKQIWIGNPANNNVSGAYKELAGLDLQINTGWKDAESGAAVAAMDPVILPFATHRIDNPTYGLELVAKLSTMVHVLMDLAERTGVMPVRWALAMRPALFWELTRYYACAYLQGVCSIQNPAGGGVYSQVIDNGDIIAARDGMRSGKYLMVDGMRIEVILDDAIDETNSATQSQPAGCFTSDIYFIPFSLLGGTAVTYLEYFDYGNPSAAALMRMPGAVGEVTANGAFFEVMDQTRGCFVFSAEIQPRLVIRTPWLFGRITDVTYCPLMQPRQPFPDDPYFKAGGETSRAGPSLYRPW